MRCVDFSFLEKLEKDDCFPTSVSSIELLLWCSNNTGDDEIYETEDQNRVPEIFCKRVSLLCHRINQLRPLLQFYRTCYRFDLNIRSKVRCDGLRPKGRSVRLPMPRRRPSFDLDSLFSAVFLQRNVSKKNRYFPYIIIIYTSRYIHLYHLSRIWWWYCFY